MEIHLFLRVNQRTKWQYSIAMLVYQREIQWNVWNNQGKLWDYYTDDYIGDLHYV